MKKNTDTANCMEHIVAVCAFQAYCIIRGQTTVRVFLSMLFTRCCEFVHMQLYNKRCIDSQTQSVSDTDMIQLECILMQGPLYFCNPKRFFFFFTSEGKEPEDKKYKLCGWGPSYSTQDYIVNICKAIHALQRHWSTRMHRHLHTHQSQNSSSTG